MKDDLSLDLAIADTPDTIARCLVADNAVRAASVQLGQVWQHIRGARALPAVVETLLGELCAAAPLLAATLKFDGTLVIQLQGDAASPVRLMVVEYSPQHTLRAAVKLNDEYEIKQAGLQHLGLQQLISAAGSGRFIVVLDPTQKMPGQTAYTSLVPIVGDSVATSIDYYMSSSEQLPTRIMLAANSTHCAGMLLQRLPNEGGIKAVAIAPALNEHGHEISATDAHDDTWLRMRHLLNTVKPQELLATSSVTMLRRLFWQENPTAASSQTLRFVCPCSRQKVGKMLKMLGAVEVESIIAERGDVEVLCDYCEQQYLFDAVDCAALLRADGGLSASGAVH